MRVLISSKSFVSNISLYKKTSAKYDQKYLVVFMWSTRYSILILVGLDFPGHFSEKYPKYQIL